jgi:Ca2+-binding EF-hand superfamily protein
MTTEGVRLMRLLLGLLVLACSACSNGTSAAAPTTKDEAVRREFDVIDTNRNGQISHQEWAGLESRMAASVPEEQRPQYVEPLEIKFKSLDSNGDGNVTFAEYQAHRLRTPSLGR